MKNLFLENWMASDYEKFVFKGTEKPQAAAPAKAEKVDTVQEGEAADAVPPEKPKSKLSPKESREKAEAAHSAAEEEHEEAAGKADELIAATQQGESADAPAPAKAKEAPASAEEASEGGPVDLFSGDKELQLKTQQYARKLAEDIRYRSEAYLRSLTPEQRKALTGFEKRIAKLPPEERTKAFMKFAEGLDIDAAKPKEAGAEEAESDNEEGKKEDTKEGDKPTEEEAKSTVVEAAKEGGFIGLIEKLIEKFGKLFEQIGNWISEKFDGMTPKFKKSPIGGTEKFTIESADKGVNLKTKKAGLDATWVKDSEAKVVDKGPDYVKIGNAEGIVTYTNIKPEDLTIGATVKPGAKLGTIEGDTLNLQMEDKDGKSEDPTSLLRGFVDKTETPDDKFPDFSADSPPMELSGDTKLPLSKDIGADQKLEISAGNKTDVKMISDGTIKSISEDGTVTISCKGKTEIIITGLNRASIIAKKGDVKKAGSRLGTSPDGVFTIQILKDGKPQDPYSMGMTDYLPPKAVGAETTPAATAEATPAVPTAQPTAPTAPPAAPVAQPTAPTAPPSAPAPVESKPEATLESHRMSLIEENLKDYVGKSTPISKTSEFNVKLPFIEGGSIVEVPCVIKGGNKVEVGGIKYDLELPASAELTGLEIPELNLQDGTAILTASKFMFSDTAVMSLADMLGTLDALRKGPATHSVQIGGKTATFKKTA